MSPRDDFEKLFRVPEGAVFNKATSEYHMELKVLGDKIKVRILMDYQNLWQGFQAGHAQGLEDSEKACIVIEDRYDALNETGRANSAFACAEAIRAMKGEVR